jgi:hypothetical protein
MKAKLFFVAAALLLSVAATSTCYAQQTVLATVKIPFAFQDGNRTLPAGEYRVEHLLTGNGSFERLQQIDGDTVMTVLTMSVEAKTGNPNPKLVFNSYGHTYFLSQIWTGEPQGRKLFKSNREKEMAREQVRSEIALLLQPTSTSVNR